MADVTPLRRPQQGAGGLRSSGSPDQGPVTPGPPGGHASPCGPQPLWREVLGRRLRELRTERHEKLAETAGRAGISPQYLSEVERGRKEPSSEMIAALAGAFDLTLIDLVTLVREDLRPARGPRPAQAPRRGAPGPVALLAMAS
jgi:DNA-binding XRE family transcriptional regulator